MKFWVFDPPMMVGRWAFAYNIEPEYGEAPRCPSCGRWIGMKPWLPPYRIRLVEGTKSPKPADVITGPGFSGFIASERFAAEFKRAHLTGVDRWEPVHIKGYSDYEGDPIASPADLTRTYHYAILPAPRTRAKLRHAVYTGPPPVCPVCQGAALESYQGLDVDETSWTGADVFITINAGLVVVTDRFAGVCQAGEITGMHLVPTAEFEPSWSQRHREAT